MNWANLRRGLDVTTHGTFNEPAGYTPPGGGESRPIGGIFTEGSTVERLTDELGYEAREPSYEIRKEADEGPWTVDNFAEQGELVLNTGARYVVQAITQTDTLITLILAAIED